MKMLSCFTMAVLIWLVAFWSGCATYNQQSRLGQYRFVTAEYHVGPPVRVIPIWIDRDFGEADKIAIDDAINQWNYVLNGYVKLNVVDTHFDMEVDKIKQQEAEHGWLFMKIKSDNKMIPAQNEKGYWTIGFANKLGGEHMYLVRDRLSNEDIFGVTLHEIGHLLGADHVGQRLMYPHYTRAGFQCVDWISMNAVANFQGLQPDRLNYCVDADIVEIPQSDGGPSAVSCPVNRR